MPSGSESWALKASRVERSLALPLPLAEKEAATIDACCRWNAESAVITMMGMHEIGRSAIAGRSYQMK